MTDANAGPYTPTAAGELNRLVGWSCMAVGIAVGLVMGLWSFDGPFPVPAWLGGYTDASRRLARLGHIAFVALGVINVVMARETPRRAADQRLHRLALLLMNFGNVLLPATLLAAAAWHPIKYAMSLPATAVLLALGLTAWCLRPFQAAQR